MSELLEGFHSTISPDPGVGRSAVVVSGGSKRLICVDRPNVTTLTPIDSAVAPVENVTIPHKDEDSTQLCWNSYRVFGNDLSSTFGPLFRLLLFFRFAYTPAFLARLDIRSTHECSFPDFSSVLSSNFLSERFGCRGYPACVGVVFYLGGAVLDSTFFTRHAFQVNNAVDKPSEFCIVAEVRFPDEFMNVFRRVLVGWLLAHEGWSRVRGISCNTHW